MYQPTDEVLLLGITHELTKRDEFFFSLIVSLAADQRGQGTHSPHDEHYGPLRVQHHEGRGAGPVSLSFFGFHWLFAYEIRLHNIKRVFIPLKAIQLGNTVCHMMQPRIFLNAIIPALVPWLPTPEKKVRQH
jgi:hypothetical protein